ncbi:MAG: aminopeptidase P family protein [Bacteroidales bacterium]|nr:aminopeptidase P family protein [Bacteroidales bacterium]
MNQCLHQLRQAISATGVDAYIIFNTDPHSCEYVPDDFLVIRHLCGFTGDNATVVVTQTFAGLWTDSRFYISGNEELKDSGVTLMKSTESTFLSWLRSNLKEGAVVAFDGRCTTASVYFDIKKKLAPLNVVLNSKLDLAPSFWIDRPKGIVSKVYAIDVEYAGLSAKEKIELLVPKIKDESATKLLTSDLAEIAWILNLRASDISYCPVFKAFMIVGCDGSVVLFTDNSRFDKNISNYLADLGVVVCDYDLIYTALSGLSAETSVLVDVNSASAELYLSINPQCKIIERRSPIQLMKACKNETELANIRKTMVVDGVAMEKFFYWLETQLDNSKPVTELDAAAKLLEYRQQGENFISESFECISAFNQHSAMPHFAPDKNNNLLLEKDGVYLVDSGGQYFTGTTDLTRVIPTGKMTDDFVTDYTLVLKAMVNISMALFPEKTCGSAIDAIGRVHLWKHGKDFGHGTGHGVGFCLNVHEGPVSISPGATRSKLQSGMVTSNEPGLYIEGKYGIRIENLLAVKHSDFEGFNNFETLTLCHIDTRPVRRELLSEEELNFINDYNKCVFDTLSPFLTDDEKSYLKCRTSKI